MPFVKGQSGNPGGRPKGISLTHLLRHRLDEPGPDGRPKRDMVADTLISLALAGNIDAIKVIFDRLDGKVATPVNLQGDQRVRITLDWGDGGDA